MIVRYLLPVTGLAAWAVMTSPVAPSRWLTREQVAEHAQVSLSTVKAWIRDGQLDTIKIGRFVRITPEALADLQDRRTRRAAENTGSSRRRARQAAARRNPEQGAA